MCSHKFRKKSKKFVPRDKNDQICTTALYIHGYILWFSYAFKVCSKSVFEIWYIHPVIVVGAVITHKMFDTGTKHLLATDGQLKVFLGPCGWIQSSNHLHVHSLQSLCQPTKMYHRCSWHTKNTWCFLYLFLWSMICWNVTLTLKAVMRNELDKNYQLFRALLFNPILKWGLEKPEILTEM